MNSTLNIIIVVFLHLVSARNDSLSKNYQFSNQNLAVSDISFDNKTLFYALYTQSTKQCTIIQEIHPFTNYSVSKKCNFVLKVDKIQLIVGFGTEKAILIAQEASPKSLKLKAITVHIADCKTKEVDLVEVPLEWANRKLYRDNIDVVVSQNGFEVIIKGLSHLCTKPDAKVYCGLNLDVDGNKIEGPLIWPKMAYEQIDLVSPVMADATGQGYYFVNRDTSLLAFQLNRKGGPKYVKLWYTPIPHSNIWREGYSIANHVDGMCYNFNSTIGCWQTDQEGERRILVEFEFDHKFKASIKQCNITQPSKVKGSTSQTTVIPDTTIQTNTTTPSTTIQLTTAQETTAEETTTQEITTQETTTQKTIAQEANTEKITAQENLTSDTTAEVATIKEETTEDTIMEPHTVIGITEKEITLEATTQRSTIENASTNDGNVQEKSTTQDNTTESNAVQETNITQDVTESDTLQNNVSDDNTKSVQVTTENVVLENVTADISVLENITEYNTIDVITVQGLPTQALTTQIIETQENTTTESAVKETTGQDETTKDISVQEITTVQDNTTEKNIVRRSLSQIKSAEDQKVWNLFIHNLRNGGFIVMVVTCPNRICNGNDEHYYLMKINTQGKLSGQLEVNIKSKCNAEKNEVLAKVFENDQGQYCSVRLCKSKKPKEEQLEILVNCYCNSDFK